ncbi:MAG: T9SS type A sorting domain-containing protein [Candidatus Cloacimonetes bacterium]|nr:T9SS type A sorting domain-containing protein [Candidatus Cloacimonadota bacterium]
MIKGKLFVACILVTLFIPAAGLAYSWSEIGPTDIETYNFHAFSGDNTYEIICEENGIIVNEGAEWLEYSCYDLPVWDVETVISDSIDIIAVAGNGTDSDGIYGFNFSSHEFQLLQALLNPRFIKYCPADTSYYAGGEDGLYKSADSLLWQPVQFFEGMNCKDMAFYNEHYVVAANNDIIFSVDAGVIWEARNLFLPFCDLEVNESGEFYGIFPDNSYSSGLYKSDDYGDSWAVEIWTMYISCAGFDHIGNLFVGWNIPEGNSEGVALWRTDIMEMQYMNDGLNCLQINQISWNPLIDSDNVIACTENGIYMLTDYLTGTDPDQVVPQQITAYNYPNPFNPDTEISFFLPENAQIELKIYNSRGQQIRNLFCGNLSAGNNSLSWDGKNDQGLTLASGIYHYQLTSSNSQLTGKMLMIK